MTDPKQGTDEPSDAERGRRGPVRSRWPSVLVAVGALAAAASAALPWAAPTVGITAGRGEVLGYPVPELSSSLSPGHLSGWHLVPGWIVGLAGVAVLVGAVATLLVPAWRRTRAAAALLVGGVAIAAGGLAGIVLGAGLVEASAGRAAAGLTDDRLGSVAELVQSLSATLGFEDLVVDFGASPQVGILSALIGGGVVAVGATVMLTRSRRAGDEVPATEDAA